MLRGERVLRPLVARHGGTLRWFRHPYLHLGRSAELQHRNERFFAEHGYRIAPVTVDDGEWIYARAYAAAWNAGDAAAQERLATDYRRYMLAVVEFYEQQARRIVGRPIPQVLLVHANALNADHLGELLAALEARGTRWIGLDEAVADPVYRRPTDGYTGPGGISWLHRWAITAGLDRAVFAGEPEVPAWVEEMPAAAPPRPAALGPPAPLVVDRVEVRALRSAVNGVDYELRIALPHGYDDPARRFPVVYTLDADYSFLIARNIVDHLSERRHLPEAIVVGIAYGGPLRYRLNRTRDDTPTFVATGGYGREWQRVSGGGPAFQRVLAEEILPLVDRAYRTDPGGRTLVGHSYGGLFATWTLLTRPGLFANVVAVSPSLWYDDRLVLRLEEAYADGHDRLPARLYLCVGSRERNGDHDMVADLETLAGRLARRHYRDLHLAHRVMPGETHNSIFPGCLSDGLRFVLAGR